MHGLFHIVLKSFVVDNFGEQTWVQALHQAQVSDEQSFLELCQHGDEVWVDLMISISRLVQAPVSSVACSFGTYWARMALKSKLFNMLKALGSTMFDLLLNLNLVHHGVEQELRTSSFPAFSIVSENGSPNTFRLCYSSSRVGMDSFLRGVLTEVARSLYRSNLEMEVVDGAEEQSTNSRKMNITWMVRISPEGPEAELSGGRLKVHATHSELFSFGYLHQVLADCCSPPLAATTPEETHSESFRSALAAATAVEGMLKGGGQTLSEADSAHEVSALDLPDWLSSRDILPFDILGCTDAEMRSCYAERLFCKVQAGLVAAPWEDDEALRLCATFWNHASKGSIYNAWASLVMSEEGQEGQEGPPVTFVSHSWAQPADWHSHVGHTSYEEIKATELCRVARLCAELLFSDHHRWREVNFWVDKSCIPQGNDALLECCVGLIEDFIQLSNGLVVLLTWSYFTRLWCVYEWACFLIKKSPSSILICVDPFLRCSTLPLFLASIKNFSLARCECHVESDRALLLEKVDQYYISTAAFERFLKFTAIALVARTVAETQLVADSSAVTPWIELASECCFVGLAGALQRLVKQSSKWRETKKDLRLVDIKDRVKRFFRKEVNPLFVAVRQECVRSDVITFKSVDSGASAQERFRSTKSSFSSMSPNSLSPERKKACLSELQASLGLSPRSRRHTVTNLMWDESWSDGELTL